MGGTKDRAAQYSTAGKVPINTQALNSPGTLSAKNQSLSLSASPYPGSAQAIQNKASPQRLSPLKVLLVGQRVDWLRTAEQEIHNEQSAVGSISSASEYFQLPAADEGSSVEDSELKREIEHEVGSDSEYSEEDDGYHFQSEESDVSLAEDDIKDKNGKRNASSECIQLEPFIVQEAPTEDASTDPTILYQDVSEVELLLKKYSSLISQKTRTLKAVRDGYEDAEEDMSLSINFDDLLVDRLAAITPNSADGSLWLMSSGLGESGAGKSLITAATDEDLCEPETPKDTPQVCLSAQDSYASKLDGSRSQSTPNSSRSQSRSGSRQGSSRSSAKSSYSSYTSQSGSTGSSRLSAVEQDPTKYMSVPVLDESSHESDSNDPDVPEGEYYMSFLKK